MIDIAPPKSYRIKLNVIDILIAAEKRPPIIDITILASSFHRDISNVPLAKETTTYDTPNKAQNIIIKHVANLIAFFTILTPPLVFCRRMGSS